MHAKNKNWHVKHENYVSLKHKTPGNSLITVSFSNCMI
jgi:hypothetical protein